jgi:hypothetical protein
MSLMFALITGSSQLIAILIPLFAFEGQSLTFLPIPMYWTYIAIGIAPVALGLILCSERAPLITRALLIMIMICASCFVFSFKVVLFISSPETISEVSGWMSLTLIIISSWVFLIITARIICYGKDLILQTDRS